jgi:MFS transporter, OFA family, oxalate/formate antiporter
MAFALGDNKNLFLSTNEEPMQGATVCPFFRKGDDYCDVGCGYISPSDVTVIIAHCHGRYRECAKFDELAARFPREITETPSPQPAANPVLPGKPLIRPFSVKWPLPFQMQYASANYGNSPIPTKERNDMAEQMSNAKRGWTVALAGTGINLALGILYTWSIFKESIAASVKSGDGIFNWDAAAINDPYAVACLVFAFAMILAGKFQDKFGPRLTVMIGGLLVGLGFLWISQTTDYWSWVLGFGVLAGMGIGFGYSAATPPALKWFPPAKTGLIAGIVVSGFGLASVYIAPLAQYLLGAYGLQQSMMIFGIAFTVVVCGLGMLVTNPPKGYVPVAAPVAGKNAAPAKPAVEMTPSQVLRTGKFYVLWAGFFIGAGAGLMVIGSIAGMAKQSLGEMAFLVVAIMAVGNAAGRIVAGIVSDRIGRGPTLAIMLFVQALLMFAAIPVLGSGSGLILTLLATFIGFNYGTNLALFPSFAKDQWGLKNFGMNYGLLFSAWGIGAFTLVRLAEMLKASTGSFTASFLAAGVMLSAGSLLTAFTFIERKAKVAQEELLEEEYEEEDLVID